MKLLDWYIWHITWLQIVYTYLGYISNFLFISILSPWIQYLGILKLEKHLQSQCPKAAVKIWPQITVQSWSSIVQAHIHAIPSKYQKSLMFL